MVIITKLKIVVQDYVCPSETRRLKYIGGPWGVLRAHEHESSLELRWGD